jgi:hypothetical protein
MTAERLNGSDLEKIVEHLSILDRYVCRAGSPYSKCSVADIALSLEIHEELEELIEKIHEVI